MVSRNRKKNKGKDRKAKKMEAERAKAHQLWRGFATMGGEKLMQCKHGCILPNEDHPVSKFMDDFITIWNEKSVSAVDLTHSSFRTHQLIWNDESYRQNAINILLRIGTNMLIHADDNENENLGAALSLARVIIILKHHDGADSLEAAYNSRDAALMMRDITASSISSKRDALKFFSKKVPCSCLKKMYQETRRTLPKMGRCFGCRQEKERVALSVCSRCMLVQYCSRECQVADWHGHVGYCDQYVKNHK